MKKKLMNSLSRMGKEKMIPRKLWILFLTIFFLFTCLMMGMGWYINKTYGVMILDAHIFGYSPSEAYQILRNMGESGRRMYLYLNMMDFIYPFFYAIFFMNVIKRQMGKIDEHSILKFIPFTACFMDIGENVCIFSMLNEYPDKLLNVAKIASYFTITKFFFIAIVIIIAILLFLRKVISKK